MDNKKKKQEEQFRILCRGRTKFYNYFKVILIRMNEITDYMYQD